MLLRPKSKITLNNSVTLSKNTKKNECPSATPSDRAIQSLHKNVRIFFTKVKTNFINASKVFSYTGFNSLMKLNKLSAILASTKHTLFIKFTLDYALTWR